MKNPTLPAILGGSPARQHPYPPPNFIGESERKLVNQVLDSGVLSAYVAHDGPYFLGGPMVHALEAEFCERFGSKFAVSVNSATSGLHAAVAAALAGPGHEVIVPPYTMSATATAVTMTGATPIFCDIRPDTFCLDIDEVKKKLTPLTRAIIAVNLFGGPADLRALRQLADERGMWLIEDNAQAPGATEQGRWTGTIGHMGVFSLNCHKTVQCGEGGVVLTNDATLADRLRLVRNHGEVVQDQRTEVPAETLGLVGCNYRLTELQSAVALAQIRRLDELTEPRVEMANALSEGLRGLEGITTPYVAPGNRHVYYLYALRIDAERFGLSRAQLQRALDNEGITCAAGYVRPIYLYPMYRRAVAAQKTGLGAGHWHPTSGESYGRGLCPVTERMYEEELLTTTICRADLGKEDVREFVEAFDKIHRHRQALAAYFERSP